MKLIYFLKNSYFNYFNNSLNGNHLFFPSYSILLKYFDEFFFILFYIFKLFADNFIKLYLNYLQKNIYLLFEKYLKLYLYNFEYKKSKSLHEVYNE